MTGMIAATLAGAATVAGQGGHPPPPIALNDGMIVSSGCQWHGCDRGNWAILIDPAGKRARVCFFDGGAMARWYAGDGRSLLRAEDCP